MPPTDRNPHLLRALRWRNYRLYFFSQGLSLIGTWMTFVATGWLVYRLRHSAAFCAMRMPPMRRPPSPRPLLGELRDGLLYAYRFAPIKALLSLTALVSLVGLPYTVLMPVFAREILHGGAHTLGFLMGASGLGALPRRC